MNKVFTALVLLTTVSVHAIEESNLDIDALVEKRLALSIQNEPTLKKCIAEAGDMAEFFIDMTRSSIRETIEKNIQEKKNSTPEVEEEVEKRLAKKLEQDTKLQEQLKTQPHIGYETLRWMRERMRIKIQFEIQREKIKQEEANLTYKWLAPDVSGSLSKEEFQAILDLFNSRDWDFKMSELSFCNSCTETPRASALSVY